MKVAAYQAPLLPSGSREGISMTRERVRACEAAGVDILCCPEAIIGGLADYAAQPGAIALDVDGGELAEAVRPLASDTVTTIVGFTERDPTGRFYNAAAVVHRGAVVGRYRKRHPAINRSVYHAGDETPVFTIGGLTFGILICFDSTHAELWRTFVSLGASVLFIPTNNGLPTAKAEPAIVADTQRADIARAAEHRVWVVRADVAGRTPDLVAYGSSAIVDPNGNLVAQGQGMAEDLLIASIRSV